MQRLGHSQFAERMQLRICRSSRILGNYRSLRKTPVDQQVSAAESAGAGDFEPKLIDSQALDFCVERLRRECQFGRRARWP
jgi:hypothetical protein